MRLNDLNETKSFFVLLLMNFYDQSSFKSVASFVISTRFGILTLLYGKQLASPAHPSAAHPSLRSVGGRGMSWENKLQTPYGTSSPCIS